MDRTYLDIIVRGTGWSVPVLIPEDCSRDWASFIQNQGSPAPISTQASDNVGRKVAVCKKSVKVTEAMLDLEGLLLPNEECSTHPVTSPSTTGSLPDTREQPSSACSFTASLYGFEGINPTFLERLNAGSLCPDI